MSQISDVLTIWHLFVVQLLFGVSTTFTGIANESYLPSLVGREHLVDANSKVEGTRSIGEAVGPGLAGTLIHLLTAPIVILVNALSFLVSATLLLMIHAPEPPPDPLTRRERIRKEITAGLRPLYDDPILRSIAAASTIFLLFNSVLFAVYILYTTRNLGVSPAGLGVIFGAGGVGAILGAMVATSAARTLGLGSTLIVASLLAALAGLVIPLAGHAAPISVVLLTAAQLVYRGGATIFDINVRSLRQVITPDHILGRVNASYRFLTLGVASVGPFLGGILGTAIGLRATLVVAGAGMLLPILWLALSPVRGLRIVDAQTD